MIEAYEVGVSLVMSEAILESLSLVNSKLLDMQQIIMGSNAALKRLNSLTKDAVGPMDRLANAWKNIATAAGAAAASAARMSNIPAGGYGQMSDGYRGAGGAGSVPGPFTPSGLVTYATPPLPIGTSKLPAVVTPGANTARQTLSLETSPTGSSASGMRGSGPFIEAAAGMAGALLVKSIFGAGASMDAVESYMKAAGWSDPAISAAAKQADYVRRTVKGTNLLQKMEEIYEIGSALKNNQEAIDFLPLLMKQSIVASLPTGENQLDIYNTAFQMAQSTELSGQLINPKTNLIDPKKLAAYATDIADLSLATAGRVTAADFVDLAKNAGAGVMSQLTPEALIKIAPLLLSLGGARTGTALNALAMQFKGGKMSEASARALQELIANAPQIEAYEQSASAIQGQNTYADVADNPVLQAQALSASWQAFMTVSGQAWMPDAIKAIDGMTSLLNAAGNLAKEYPKINNALLDGIAALSVGALGGLAVWFVKIGGSPWLKGVKWLNTLTDTVVGATGEIGAAAAGVASVVSGLAELAVIAGAAWKATNFLNSSLDKIFHVPEVPTPAPIVNAENWLSKHVDGILGWKYTPQAISGPLVPGAAHPILPQPTQAAGPIPVHVTNPKDIHNGVAQSFTQQLNGIQTGPTGFDYSFGHPTVAGAW